MNTAQAANDEQAALWNGLAGQTWVAEQDLLDQMLKPFEDLIAAAVPTGFDGRVLEIGCGTGAVALAVARRLGANGRCTGLDISEPMLALARTRAERAGVRLDFVHADAQTHAFEPAIYDRIISRFGVMFFDDSVRAFANMRRAARKGCELAFIAWRSAAQNPFMTTAERAAAPFLPELPPRKPNAPGQFAFADDDLVRRVLADSCWEEITIKPLDVECAMPETALLRYATRMGPLGLALAAADEATRARVIESISAAFVPYVEGAMVRFRAACWSVRAITTK